jgi:hypothetical protein
MNYIITASGLHDIIQKSDGAESKFGPHRVVSLTDNVKHA